MSRVSVIMPAYNGAPFIGQAIRSVLDQTWTDWELIVVNDGSTDATPEILRGFSDPRIIVIQQANRGEAAARNTGLQAAHGDHVAFLDADDLYTPNALAALVGFLDNHPDLEAVFSDGFFCDAGGKILMRLSEHRPAIHTGNILEPLVLSASVISGIICTMIRRSVIEQHGIRFDERLIIGPDWDFLIHVARYARFGYLDQTICMYRIHESNITKTSGSQRRQDSLVLGRRKILNSAWFPDLSLPTRTEFLRYFVVEMLRGQITQQQEIFHTFTFIELPAHARADLWRNLGVDYLMGRSNHVLAMECLQEAVRVWPADRKSQYLRWMSRQNESLAPMLLYAWQNLIRVVHRLHSLGQHRSRPVPPGLRPAPTVKRFCL